VLVSFVVDLCHTLVDPRLGDARAAR
jgi:hypothetical protein